MTSDRISFAAHARALTALVLAATALATNATTAAAQQTGRSRTEGFYVGVGAEATNIITSPNGFPSTNESGGGGDAIIGYGFNPRWSMFAEVAGATINAEDGGTYSLTHVDLGARLHFRADRRNIVVPFVQFGLSERGESQDFTDQSGDHTLSANGLGFFVGGGLNAHFTPTLALSTSLAWSVGYFTTYRVDDQDVSGQAVAATSARFQLGMIWFPGG